MTEKKQLIRTIETTYKINYRTGNPVPILDIIESLQGVQDLLLRTPKFIEAAYGVSVIETNVYVKSLESGSLIEEFLIEYVVGGHENLDAAKVVIENMVADGDGLKTLVAVGVGAVLMWGISKSRAKSNPTKHIEAYNNTIVNIGGKVKLEADNIKTILEGITDSKTLAKNAVKVMKPAKSDNSKIEVSDIESLTISSDLVKDSPDEYEAPKLAEKQQQYSNTPIVIYASDQDKLTSNWGGIIPQIADKRIRFELADTVNPKKLHGRKNVNADLILISKLNTNTGDYQPAKAIITKVE